MLHYSFCSFCHISELRRLFWSLAPSSARCRPPPKSICCAFTPKLNALHLVKARTIASRTISSLICASLGSACHLLETACGLPFPSFGASIQTTAFASWSGLSDKFPVGYTNAADHHRHATSVYQGRLSRSEFHEGQVPLNASGSCSWCWYS